MLAKEPRPMGLFGGFSVVVQHPASFCNMDWGWMGLFAGFEVVLGGMWQVLSRWVDLVALMVLTLG